MVHLRTGNLDRLATAEELLNRTSGTYDHALQVPTAAFETHVVDYPDLFTCAISHDRAFLDGRPNLAFTLTFPTRPHAGCLFEVHVPSRPQERARGVRIARGRDPAGRWVGEISGSIRWHVLQ